MGVLPLGAPLCKEPRSPLGDRSQVVEKVFEEIEDGGLVAFLVWRFWTLDDFGVFGEAILNDDCVSVFGGGQVPKSWMNSVQ